MIALLTSGAMLRGYAWWYPPNLLGSTFYGLRALRSSPGWATLAGYAFHIVTTGTVGILFGLACGGLEHRRRLMLLGGLAGLIWYFFASTVFWTWVNPLVPLYSLQPDTLVAHALFGMCLGRMGQVHPVEQAGPADEAPPPLPAFYREPGLEVIEREPVAMHCASDNAQTLEDKVE